MIEAGKPAPDFTAPTNGNGTVSLGALRGRNVVLYFYPKDDTPGCTRQAIGFTETLAEFTKTDTVVVGVSRDSVKKHDKFVAKHGLGIVLVADGDLAINEMYGVWVEKSMYGRKYMGTERTTILIDREGIIRRVWSGVKVPGHVEEVLDAARTL